MCSEGSEKTLQAVTFALLVGRINDDFKMCQLNSRLLLVVLQLMNAISDSSSPHARA